MVKSNSFQKYVYKISTDDLKVNDWNLTLTYEEAKENNQIIALADSNCLRIIDSINGTDNKNTILKIKELKRELSALKQSSYSLKNKEKIKKIYKSINALSFKEDYICLVANSKKDYIKATKGFYVNGIRYTRLLSTTGQLKKSTIVFVSEKIHDELLRKLENGRNSNLKLIPSKYNSYLSLACSSSVPVSEPKVLVVKDCIVEFVDTFISIKDNPKDKEPIFEIVTEKISNNINDGFGLISPKQAKLWSNELNLDYTFSGCCIRNAFLKGMLYCFDFHEFAKKIAKSDMVIDIWGEKKNIDDVDIIVTESMLKLWNAYNSYEEYHNNCIRNGFTYSITKVTPKKLDNIRNLNYQYLQSYKLSSEDIDKLIKPTLDNIKDILSDDINKTILYLKGYFIGEKTIDKLNCDFAKALMIDKNMINDPFVQSKLRNMISKKINDAKIGVLQCNGNFSLLSGDPYALCQSIFGLKITGLLNRNEFYSKYWNNKGVSTVLAFRSPMSCHNNIRKFNLINNDDVSYWYRYMNEVTILNGFDLTNASLNGCDFDGDQIFTTNNEVLLRNTKDTLPIVCFQKKGEKIIVTKKSLIQSDMRGFGDEIGSTTNKITEMFDIQSAFDEFSTEYKTLEYRIMCGQKYQQDAIDKIKGIENKPMPKYWYDKHYIDNCDTLNNNIVANKKPYFFIYNYPELKSQYKQFQKDTNIKSMMLFGKTLEQLINSNDISNDEKIFLDWYYKLNPVSDNKSTMNLICHKIEKEIEQYEKKLKNNLCDFDYNILKTNNVQYDNSTYIEIQKIYFEFQEKIRSFKVNNNSKISDKESFNNARTMFIDQFKEKCYTICNNKNMLGNIILDICYSNNYSKQFAWDICGDVFINNLLKKNNNRIKYLELVSDDTASVNNNNVVRYNGLNFVEKYVML